MDHPWDVRSPLRLSVPASLLILATAMAPAAAPAARAPNYYAGPADFSQSVIQRAPRVSVSKAVSSLPFALIPVPVGPAPQRREAEVEYPALPYAPAAPDPVLQLTPGPVAMPSPLLNILGQGTTLSPSTRTGVPPDPVGAAGPNHFVQAVNGGIMIWDKSGSVVLASRLTNTLWTGYPATDGNHCATENDGDAIVLYDPLADRWFVSQYDIHNYINSLTAPAYQCVAVSKTGDPTGAWWLYDFKYNFMINDYPKFGVWRDAYYASFNNFNPSLVGADLCAYDRASMLQGLPATQMCFQQPSSFFGLLPASLDGSVQPPLGEPAFFVNFGSNALRLWKFHADWTVPANSTFTGPITLPVVAFTIACPSTGQNACVPQPSPGNTVSAFSDRLMFRLTYRNFGTHESLLVNHTIQANGTSGVRWYEIRSPAATPMVFQQGTYAPNDGNWRWMGSLAMDQAGGIALGYSLSSATQRPSITWAGRLSGDAGGTMGQAEAIVATGAGVESGTFGDGTVARRWGDYSAMTVDPADDCTFWFTSELYVSNGTNTWDTRIASVKFPACAANDFFLGVSPALQPVAPGGQVAYTVTTGLSTGTAESIVLNVQDLPSGVTGSFTPSSVTAGASSTLTLTASAAAPLTGSPVTFTVIGTAPSALHPATAQVNVVNCTLPPSVGNTLRESHGASTITFTWTDLPAATGYIVEGSTTPNGSFTTTVGTASSGNPGVTAPLPAGAWFFEVAGQNACGTGPLN